MKKRGGTCRARLCLLCAAVCLTAAFLTLTASAQRFPESGEFNGLYIVYNISGGRIAGASYARVCRKNKITKHNI